MERYSQDERIRRAEEIYFKRQNMRLAKERTRRATVNVNKPRDFRFLKKLTLQIVICTLIYLIYHLINTTSYSFSKDVLDKTRNILSYDTDFYGMYTSTTKTINDYINANINIEENVENQENIVSEENENNTRKRRKRKRKSSRRRKCSNR